LERHDRNYIGGILRRLERYFQAEGFFCGQVIRAAQEPAVWPVTLLWDSLTG
jgi:hypothetical protein